MQEIKINVPDGYEVHIVKKEEKKEFVVRTYQDLVNKKVKLSGFQLNTYSQIKQIYGYAHAENISIAASEKVAKSMLAMAMISQLMPYYGGAITNEEWCDLSLLKHCITCRNNKVYKEGLGQLRVFLAFHTSEQRDEFLKYNEQLVKDYLMINS